MKSEAVVAAEMNLLAIIRCHEALNFIYLSVLFIHLSSIPIPKHLLASSGMHLCHIFYLFTTSPTVTLIHRLLLSIIHIYFVTKMVLFYLYPNLSLIKLPCLDMGLLALYCSNSCFKDVGVGVIAWCLVAIPQWMIVKYGINNANERSILSLLGNSGL